MFLSRKQSLVPLDKELQWGNLKKAIQADLGISTYIPTYSGISLRCAQILKIYAPLWPLNIMIYEHYNIAI